MDRPNQARLVAAALFCSLGLGACLGVGGSTPVATTTSAAPGVAIANLAPTTLAGAEDNGGSTETTVQTAAAAKAAASGNGEPAPGRGLTTPQAAARNLWDAWRDADRPRALLYASAAAVDTLLQETWGPEIRRLGCAVVEAGHLCRFEGPSTRWDLTIEGSARTGFRVSSVSGGDPVGIDLDELGTAAVTVPITNPDGSPASTIASADGDGAADTSGSDTADGSGDTAPTTVKRRSKRAAATTVAEPPASQKEPQKEPQAPAPEPVTVPATPAPAPENPAAPVPVPVARPDQTPQ